MDLGEAIYCSRCMRAIEEEGTCPYCGYDAYEQPFDAQVLEEGTLLSDGRYILGAVIGRGGFGVTYAAWDNTLRAPVAIKEYFPEDFARRDITQSDEIEVAQENRIVYDVGMTRFGREARILSSLQNVRHVVTVHDWFEENGTGYIVMEYVRGITLERYVKERDVKPAQLLAMLREPIDALIAIHHQGVLHRDISPNNMMVQEDGAIKIIDFGAAAVQERQKQGKDKTIVLTKRYAALEQYDTRLQQGQWTDVYGLSATLYTLLTGEAPPESVSRVHKDTIVPLRKKQRAVSKRQEKAIMSGLIVEPKRRVQSVDEFRSILYNLPMPEEVQRRKRFMRRVTAVAAAIVALMALVLVNFTLGLPLGEGLRYSLRTDGWHVVGALGERTERVIPETRVGLPVTAVASRALEGDETLMHLTVPGSVKTVESMAFFGCDNLHTVALSEGVEAVDSYAFADCGALHTVQLPDSLTQLEANAFENASALLTLWGVTHDGAAQTLAEETGIPFAVRMDYEVEQNDTGWTLTAYHGSETEIVLPSVIAGQPVTAMRGGENPLRFPETATSIVLPDGVTAIESGIFSNMPALERVTLGSQVKEIAAQAFYNTALQDVALPEGLVSIGDEAFAWTYLPAIDLPETLQTIGESAFYASYLESVTLPDSVVSVGRSAFSSCVSLESFTFSSGMASISAGIFEGCYRLKTVDIPDSIQAIELMAFARCSALEHLIIPEGVVQIDAYAFMECTGLKVIELPYSLDAVDTTIFDGCPPTMMIAGWGEGPAMWIAEMLGYAFEDTSLWSDNIVVGAASGGAFVYGDDQVDDLVFPVYDWMGNRLVRKVRRGYTANPVTVDLPDFATEIETSAFLGAHRLTTVNVPDTLETIGTATFAYCDALAEFDFPEGLRSIGTEAFTGCTALTALRLPDTVTQIDDNAFFGCENVAEVHIPASLVVLSEGSFARTGITQVTVPGSVSKCRAAFYECKQLESAVLEAGVRVLWGTFSGCSSLKTVSLPSTTEEITRSTFAGCTALEDVYIYSMTANLDAQMGLTLDVYREDMATVDSYVVEDIHQPLEHLFADCENVTIHGYPGSTAEAYALRYELAFEAIE